jgi:hypothetical protein
MNMPVIPREEQEVSPSKLLLSPKFPAVRDQESPPSAVANPVAAATACRHRSALSCDDSRAARNELPRMATRPRLAWAAMNNGQLAVRCDGCDEPSRSFVGLVVCGKPCRICEACLDELKRMAENNRLASCPYF